VRRVREEPRLLRERPSVSRRAALPDHRRARNGDGRAPVRARGCVVPGRDAQGHRRAAQAVAPSLVITQVGTSVLDHLVFNTRRPPFDNVKVRQAVSRAIGRRAYAAAVYQGGAVLGDSMPPKPYGVWGMLEADLRAIPGHGSDPN